MPEVYIPGSKDPFRPVNPWGRDMPKSLRRPDRPPLYQLVVKRVGHGEIRFGPKMIFDAVAQLHRDVETAIRLGVEKELTEPHIIKVS
jgi:hypothetical protein